MKSLRASPVFSLVVLVSLGFFGYIGLMLFGGSLGLIASVLFPDVSSSLGLVWALAATA